MRDEALHNGAGRGAAGRLALLVLAALVLSACASVGPRYASGGDTAGDKPSSRFSGYRVGRPYQVNGVWYTPREQPDYDEIGFASWYGEQFHNHYTADGEVFDMRLPSAAHKTLPLPSLVEVTNLSNGRTLVVRVNDRGPFIDGRIIDLSREAAAELGFVAAGVTQVRVRYVGQADPPGQARLYQAANTPARPRAAQVASAPAPAGIPLANLTAPVAAAPLPVMPYPLMAEAPAAPAPVTVADASPTAAPASDIDALLNDLAAQPAPSQPPQASAQSDGARYIIQAGAFSSRAGAETAAARLAATGPTQIRPLQRADGRTLYRVVVTGFADPDAAAAARGRVAAAGFADARVLGGS